MSYLLAIIAVLFSAIFWGSQFVPRKFCKKFDIRAYNLSMVIGIFLGSIAILFLSYLITLPASASIKEISDISSSFVFLGGLSGVIWVVGNFFLLNAVDKIGMARSFPIATFLSVVAFFSGILFLGELRDLSIQFILFAFSGILLVTFGTIFTSKATSPEEKKVIDIKSGVIYAFLAALFFGVYSVPLIYALDSESFSPYLANVFLAVGALVGAFVISSQKRGALSDWFRAYRNWHLLALGGGMIWILGQVCATIGMLTLGVSLGLPLTQTLNIVSLFWGILIFKELGHMPIRKRNKAIIKIMIGIVLVIVGASILGTVKNL